MFFRLAAPFTKDANGKFSKTDVYTVREISGQEKQTPALVHMLFKKQDIVEYVSHEAQLMDPDIVSKVYQFSTPLEAMHCFSASGEAGLAHKFLKGVPSDEEDFETRF